MKPKVLIVQVMWFNILGNVLIHFTILINKLYMLSLSQQAISLA